MGACATTTSSSGKSSALIRKEVRALAAKYECLIAEIHKIRAKAITRFATSEAERQKLMDEFSFSVDFDLASSHFPGMKQRVSQPEEIIALHSIESQFSAIEKYIREKPALIVGFESNMNDGKLDRVLEMRSVIYDYFYSDLELTNIPEEII